MEPVFQEAGISAIITTVRQKVFIDRVRTSSLSLKQVILAGTGDKDTGDWNSYEEIIRNGSSETISIPLSEEDEALYLYTSGTTGRAKGVILTHDHLTYFPESIHHALPCSDADVFGLVLPISHIIGPVVLNLMVESGMSISIVDEMTPKKILDAIQRHGITISAAVPPIFQLILNVPRWERYDCSTSEGCGDDGRRRSRTVDEGVRRTISASQDHSGLRSHGNLSPSHAYSFERCPRKMASAGKVVPRVALKIIGQDGKELPIGQIGEIVARGPQIMKGYFKDPKATARKIKEGWYYTGDLGWLDEEGYLYVLGRADDMVITGGLNVYPSEVENVLLNHPKVQEAAVVGIPDAKRGQA